MKLICKLIGHRWQRVWQTEGLKKGAPMMVCLRCKEPGWVVP
jgi:hypothetical protein